MIKVLFVCLGNICRSPMAEAIFRYHVSNKGLETLFTIDSAGTGDWHIDQPPHQGTQKILVEKNIPFKGIKGRQISYKDLEEFNYIIAMDIKNKQDIETLMREHYLNIEIMTFMSFLGNHPYPDVPDPYFTGNFNEVYDLIGSGAKHLLHYICEREGISLSKSSH